MRKYTFHIAFIAVLSILWILFEVFKPTPVSWEPSLINTDKNPYGTYILFHEAASLFPGKKISVSRQPAYNQLSDSTLPLYTYLIIAPGVDFSKPELDKIRTFTESGNHVLIAANSFDDAFCDSLGIRVTSKFDFGSKADTIFHFCNAALDKRNFPVPSISHAYFDITDSTLKVTGILEDSHNRKVMIKIEMGGGSIILSTLPLMFSNWFMLQEGMSDIPFKALSYLPADKPMVWDEYQKQGRDENTSPIRAILANRALSWAYFLSLFGVLLILVFETRRRRSMVPIVEPLKNTSLEFIKVIGMLHYEQRNYSDIGQKKIVYFLEHIRLRYHLPTINTDKDFTIALAEKSGYDVGETQKMMNIINYVRYTKFIKADDLIELNKFIETFIIKTKLKI
jgi:hypothetical protein